jgi:hypothetical protein
MKLRNFSLVSLEDGLVTKASLVWVDQGYQIAAEEVFYNSSISVVPIL